MVREQKVTALMAGALTVALTAALFAASFLSVSPKKISFKAKPDEVISKRIKVKNKSASDIRLKAQPSCACVAADCPGNLKAKETAAVTVYIDTNGKKKGTQFSESVTIVAGHERIKVPITGKIK